MVQPDIQEPAMISIQPITPLRDGIATVNIIADLLDSYEILHIPENRKRRIAWMSLCLDEAVMKLPVAEHLACLLVQTSNAYEALISHPMALGLLILEENESLPNSLENEEGSIKSRLFIVRRHETSLATLELLTLLQTTLFNLYRWDMQCREIVQWNGSVQALVDISTNLFTNWIDVTDATYTLLAHVRGMEPPDTLSKNLIELGCHSAAQVTAARDTGVFGKWAEQSGIDVFSPTELVPFDHVSYIMKTGKVYRGHVVMVCNNEPPTPGFIDLFEAFAHHCERIVVGNYGATSSTLPFEGFLTHLLDNNSPRQDYIENQRAIIGIEDSSTFCFALIDNSEGSYAEQSLLLLSNAKTALPSSLVMLYENALVALFHAPEFDSLVITDQMAKLESFCANYECTAYRSNVFFAIEDLHCAYEQAQMAREYRNAIDNSMASENASRRRLVYRFSDSFTFLLGDTGETAQRLVEFTSENSHLDVIERLQLDNNVCDLKMLYRYLVNERKATPTAEQLHMHRNNVLHRMRSIEKRYHLDLESYFTRQYLLACFRLKISRSANFRKMLL